MTSRIDCSGPGTDITWTYAKGIVTLTFLDEGEELAFNVALGGRFLITSFGPFHPSEPSSNQVVFIAAGLQ